MLLLHQGAEPAPFLAWILDPEPISAKNDPLAAQAAPCWSGGSRTALLPSPGLSNSRWAQESFSTGAHLFFEATKVGILSEAVSLVWQGLALKMKRFEAELSPIALSYITLTPANALA